MTSMHTVSPEIKIDSAGLRKHFLTLTNCQKPFVEKVVSWIKKPRKLILIVSGGPGTGKSYVVKNTLDNITTVQMRMSYTARSAASIGGKTIHSSIALNSEKDSLYTKLDEELKDETDLLTTIKKSRAIFEKFKCYMYPYIVVVDEISMVTGWLMYWMIRFFMDRTELPLLFICMGDPHQLNPIKSLHNLFSITFSEKKYDVCKIHLTESKRFFPEYLKIINVLRDFVDKGDETGMFTFVCENFPVVESIDKTHLMQANRAMAFTRKQVKNFNSFYIKNLVSGPEIKITNNLVLKPGCMVFVTKNGCSKAPNGTALIFQRYDPEMRIVTCIDPKTNLEVIVGEHYYTREIALDLGFAGTVHKYQGDTIDDAKIVISFDGSRDLNLVYTALSRVREINQIVAVQL